MTLGPEAVVEGSLTLVWVKRLGTAALAALLAASLWRTLAWRGPPPRSIAQRLLDPILAQYYNGTAWGRARLSFLLAAHLALAVILAVHTPTLLVVAYAVAYETPPPSWLQGLLRETWWLHSSLGAPIAVVLLACLMAAHLAPPRPPSLITPHLAATTLTGLAATLLGDKTLLAVHVATAYLLALHLAAPLKASHWLRQLRAVATDPLHPPRHPSPPSARTTLSRRED